MFSSPAINIYSHDVMRLVRFYAKVSGFDVMRLVRFYAKVSGFARRSVLRPKGRQFMWRSAWTGSPSVSPPSMPLSRITV
jgi:hypothetical protein